jgi:hypothetical protein
MRVVIHHVADEETILLTHAESVLGNSLLMTLGRQMAVRKLQLKAPRLAKNRNVWVLGGALLMGAMLGRRALRRHL